MESLLKDIKYGIRMLAKSPGFTAVAVLALTLGIGANSAIFSMVNTFLLRNLPVEAPDQLVSTLTADRNGIIGESFSYPEFLDLRKKSELFSGVLGHSLIHVALSNKGQNDHIYGEIVTGEYFNLLGVKLALGRGFLPEEDQNPGTHPVAVIGYGLWKSRFGADKSIVGKEVLINGKNFTIVGVAPEEFAGTKFGLGMDIWIPMMMHELIINGSEGLTKSRGSHFFEIIARLKPGITLEKANAALSLLTRQLEKEYPSNYSGVYWKAVPEREGRFPAEASSGVKLAAALSMGLVGLVLLIACANVANLLLARAAARRKEIGIRLAIGASRRRLVRQMLTESLPLSLLGGAGGLLMALWLADLPLTFSALRPPIPYRLELESKLDMPVLMFTLGISILTCIIFGLVPALQATKQDLVPVLKGEEGAGQRRRWYSMRNMLVTAQVAFSLIVLVSAGLFMRSLQNAQRIDPGFKTDNVLLASMDLGLLGYEEQKGKEFYKNLLSRIEALPGVRSASLAHTLPLGDSRNSSGPVLAEGEDLPPNDRGFNTEINSVERNYLDVMGITLLQGRSFDERDTADSTPVAIINESLARRLWPNENAVGKRFRIGGSTATLREVIGVAKDVKTRSLGEGPHPYTYRPLAQAYRSEMALLVKTEGDPKAMIDSIRREINSLDANLPVFDIKTLKEHMGFALWWTRMGVALSAAFGILAMLLAAIGLYCLVSYSVSQRTREIAIRMAIGAQQGDVLKLVVKQGMALTLVGMALGLIGALALAKIMNSLLYGVSTTDLVTFVGISLLLSIVALVASLIPARKATKVDPMVALRYE